MSIIDMTCGGAVTRNVVSGGQFFQGPQVRVIHPDTRLVTITVGGNDVGYIGDLSQLAARHTHTVFGRLVASFWGGPRTTRGFDAFGSELTATLRAVQAKAPQATIVVATYPTIVPREGTCARLGLTPDEAALMRKVGDDLAATTRSIAARRGALVVDMNTLGAAHDACSAVPWTRGWTNGGIAPFHPTLAGARATAKAIDNVLAAQAAQDRSR